MLLATLAMLAHVAGPVFAIVVAAPAGPEDTCPNARQVTDALQLHVPGALVAADRPSLDGRPDVLRTVLDIPADGTVVRFTLVDGRGDVQLRRTLPGLGRGRPVSDCVALAETIATIVERYLISVPFQARETDPPPPPTLPPLAAGSVVAQPAPEPTPPADEQGRAARVYVAAARRLASAGPSRYEAQLGGELDLTRGARRLAALLRAAVDEGGEIQGAPVSLRRLGGRLGLSLSLPAGRGAFQIAVEGGLDLFLARTEGTPVEGAPVTPVTSVKATPVGEVAVGYRVTFFRHVFLRPQASLGFAILRYDASRGADGRSVFKTPGMFSTFGLAIGAVFR